MSKLYLYSIFHGNLNYSSIPYESFHEIIDKCYWPILDVIKEFKSFGVLVDVIDPHADSSELQHEYGFELAKSIGKGYDAVVVAVNHKEYLGLDEAYYKSILSDGGILVDVKGILKGKIKNLTLKQQPLKVNFELILIFRQPLQIK